MKNLLFVIESICIVMAVFGIYIFDSNCIAGGVMLLVFGGGLALCIKAEGMFYFEKDRDLWKRK